MKCNFLAVLILCITLAPYANERTPDYSYNTNQVGHSIGSDISHSCDYGYVCYGWQCLTNCYDFLQWGPNQAFSSDKLGPKLVIFKNFSYSDGQNVQIDIWNTTQNRFEAKELLSGGKVPVLSFDVPNSTDQFQYRVRLFGSQATMQTSISTILGQIYVINPTNIYHGRSYDPSQPANPCSMYRNHSKDLPHSTGQLDPADNNWFFDSNLHSANFVCYGPYVNNPYSGGERFFGVFQLSADINSGVPTDEIVWIDVAKDNGTIVVQRKLKRSEFFGNYQKQTFCIEFPSASYQNLQFRVRSRSVSGHNYIKVFDIWMFSTGAVPVG